MADVKETTVRFVWCTVCDFFKEVVGLEAAQATAKQHEAAGGVPRCWHSCRISIEYAKQVRP